MCNRLLGCLSFGYLRRVWERRKKHAGFFGRPIMYICVCACELVKATPHRNDKRNKNTQHTRTAVRSRMLLTLLSFQAACTCDTPDQSHVMATHSRGSVLGLFFFCQSLGFTRAWDPPPRVPFSV